MSGGRIASFAGVLVLLSGVFAGAGLGACGDDFDALFAGTPDGGSVDGGTNPGDGGGDGGSSDASGDGAVADTGTTDAAGDPCPKDGGTCTCSGGKSCNVTCDVDGTCTAHANTGSELTYKCEEHVDVCNVDCNHAQCDLRCDAEGTCSLACGEDATCVLRCTTRPSSCNLSCTDGVKKECDGGVFTCSPTCP